MTEAEQQQRVLCEVLRGLGYDVEMRQIDVASGRELPAGVTSRCAFWRCRWVGLREWSVWARPSVRVASSRRPDVRFGPVCRTPEEAIAWVREHVAPTLPPTG